LYPFVRRWHLSWRKTAKQKQQVMVDRLPRIQRFHQGVRKFFQSGGDSCLNTGLTGMKFPGPLLVASHTRGILRHCFCFCVCFVFVFLLSLFSWFLFGSLVSVGSADSSRAPAWQRGLHKEICDSDHAPTWGWSPLSACCHLSRSGQSTERRITRI